MAHPGWVPCLFLVLCLSHVLFPSLSQLQFQGQAATGRRVTLITGKGSESETQQSQGPRIQQRPPGVGLRAARQSRHLPLLRGYLMAAHARPGLHFALFLISSPQQPHEVGPECPHFAYEDREFRNSSMGPSRSGYTALLLTLPHVQRQSKIGAPWRGRRRCKSKGHQ